MKFPRTPHMPGSNATDDDIHADLMFPEQVVITEKMDGSNLMVSRNTFMSRNGKTPHNEWVGPFHQIFTTISPLIPYGMWIAGEFLFWRKTINYDALPSFFLMFDFIDGDMVLSWKDTVQFSTDTGILTVPEISSGSFEKSLPVAEQVCERRGPSMEGFVVRDAGAFPLKDYQNHVEKFVGPWYVPVDTNTGWNGLAGSRS